MKTGPAWDQSKHETILSTLDRNFKYGPIAGLFKCLIILFIPAPFRSTVRQNFASLNFSVIKVWHKEIHTWKKNKVIYKHKDFLWEKSAFSVTFQGTKQNVNCFADTIVKYNRFSPISSFD